MNVDNIEVNTQSSIRISLDKVLYFDPYKINDGMYDADIIFITHSHYDHFDLDSINNIKNDNTIVVAPLSMKYEIDKIHFKDYIYLNPNEEVMIDNIKINTINSYNVDKSFHPKDNNWLGYIISFNNIKYYIAGDTDRTPENEKVKCDIAFIPIGGTYTMNVDEASELVKIICPKIVIPIHYGSIVGNKNDGQELINKLSTFPVEVIEKIKF
ncbi:MAG: MBL fold metallo-hydrolase [Bacilli bacterium]|nr:MBL fold metallo-hydrolase [Bacilli bacterium]